MALNDTITALGNSIINLVDKKTPIATNNTVGMVKPDGNTISIDTNGVISSNGGGLHKSFDVVMKDHILSFEESKGLVAFGDYAYKTGSVGTRYGYPEFYERCIKEYHEGSSYEQITTRNYRSLVEGDGDSLCFIKEDYDNNIFTASRFLGGNFFQAKGLSIDSAFYPSTYDSSHRIYEIEITTGDDVKTQQCIIGCGEYQFAVMIKSSKLLYYISSNGTSWNEVNATAGTTTIQPNTTYKLVLDIKNTFTVKTFTVTLNDNIEDYVYTPSEGVGTGYPDVVVGVHTKKDNTYIYPFLGTINLATLHLDVSLVKNGIEDYTRTDAYNKIWIKKHSNGHKFYDISDVSEIDNLYNKLGMAWMYGIDTTNERVRMPRNDGYFMCGTNVGTMVQAGLPNIVGTTQNTSGPSQNTGAFKYERQISGNAGEGKDAFVSFDASRCSNLYGNSDTVQTDAVKLMGYICVGNTETEVASTEVIDVTTSENDTIPLFTGMYFDFKPNNISWLKADTVQAKSGTIYETAYNELVKCLNEVDNVYNIKVIDVVDMVEGVDYSLYWKVDQINMTFTTPSKWGLVSALTGTQRVLVAKKEPTETDSTWYNLYSDGWLEQGGIVVHNIGTSGTIALLKEYANTNYTVVSNTGNNAANNFFNLNASQKTTTSIPWTKSSTAIQGDWQATGYTEIPSVEDYTEDVYLYFKVGNAVQNTEIINVGELTEVVNNKVDISTYNNRNIRYETDWFTVALSHLYTFDISSEKIFELFKKKQYPNVHLIAQVVTATGDFEVDDIIYPENRDYIGNTGAKSTDIAICVKNSGILQVRIGNDGGFIVANSNGYTRIPITSCKYKIIMEGANL